MKAEKAESKPGSTGGQKGPLFFNTPNKVMVNKAQLQLYLHQCDVNGQHHREDLSKALLESTFPNRHFTDKDLIIYFPVCLGNVALNNASNFRKLLKDNVQRFHPRKVHFAILITDELNRHNIAKEKIMLDETPRSARNDMRIYTPSPTSCLKANDTFRPQAKALGDTWLSKIPLEQIAQEIGCRITAFRWGEVINTDDFRMLFTEKMGLTASQNNPFLIGQQQPTTKDLASFAQHQLSYNSEFAKAVTPQLVKLENNDKSIFRKHFNAPLSRKCIESYLFEEMAHIMTVLASAGDLIDIFIQPEALNTKKNNFFFGETLNYWTRELLTQYLNEVHPSAPGTDFKNSPGLLRYITAAHPLDYFLNTAHDGSAMNDKRRKTSRESAEQYFDNHDNSDTEIEQNHNTMPLPPRAGMVPMEMSSSSESPTEQNTPPSPSHANSSSFFSRLLGVIAESGAMDPKTQEESNAVVAILTEAAKHAARGQAQVVADGAKTEKPKNDGATLSRTDIPGANNNLASHFGT